LLECIVVLFVFTRHLISLNLFFCPTLFCPKIGYRSSGTASEPVTFTKAESLFWNGIGILSANANADISYAIIEYANKGIRSEFISSNTLHIDHSTIQHNYYGLYLYYGDANLLAQNKIINNEYGFYLTQNSNCSFGSSASEWNCIYDNNIYDFYNDSSNDVTAQYVYWGTTDPTLIAQHIYDQNDNSSKGLVTFEPYLTTDPCAGQNIPSNVQIPTMSGGQITLSWSAVPGAVSYKVYSSNSATSGFTEDTSGTFNGTTWTAGVSGNKKFYYITAVL